MIDHAHGGHPRSFAVRALPRALAAAGLVAAGAVVASCNLVIGAGNYKVSPCGGFAFAASACAVCAGDTCCAEGAACRADTACAALYDCTTACTTAPCRNQCAVEHPVGDDAAAKALDVCLSKSGACGDACSTCGGLGEWYADECSACVQKLCCDTAKACADDDVCAERQRCYRACVDPTCPIACDAQVAASAAQSATSDAIASFDQCLAKGCGKQCAYGAHWGCVGAFSWPPHTGQDVKLTIRTTSFLTDEPLENVTIKVCPLNDFPCTSKMNEVVQSDKNGIAEITVPSGFNGYFDATDPADDAMESLVYLAWPILSPATYDLKLGPYDLYKTLVMNGGGTVDDTKGAIFAFAEDCLGAGAAGVQFDVFPLNDADAFYFVGGSPVDGQMETSSDGIGGYANVDPGTATFTAKRADTMAKVATIAVQVRVKTLTYVSLSPTP